MALDPSLVRTGTGLAGNCKVKRKQATGKKTAIDLLQWILYCSWGAKTLFLTVANCWILETVKMIGLFQSKTKHLGKPCLVQLSSPHFEKCRTIYWKPSHLTHKRLKQHFVNIGCSWSWREHLHENPIPWGKTYMVSTIIFMSAAACTRKKRNLRGWQWLWSHMQSRMFPRKPWM